MHRIAVYDLDKTLLRHATFTPFLAFAAWKRSRWRVLLLPIWIAVMLAYKLGAMSRGRLKELGLRMILGKRVDGAVVEELGERFGQAVWPNWLSHEAGVALEVERAEGWTLVLATAAMDFVAGPIARKAGTTDVIATRHRLTDGVGPVRIEGRNCYAAEKLARFESWLDDAELDRANCEIRFYSDSISDAPLLDFADDAVLVDPSVSARRVAAVRGWRTVNFNS
ncbi:HAD-IB family hydrolase [Alteripontixanthobacter maritimus]|nr:HAD-IB family hydrolase [Alteripontixanthobacter maritimus]